MGAKDTVPGATASEEAADWFLRLQEPDCPARARAEFQRWHAADPAHAAAYRRVQRLWADASELAREDPALGDVARRALHHRPGAEAPMRRWRPLLAVAATLIVAVVVGGYLLTPRAPTGTQYATAAGEQRNVALADGSTLTLDTRTVLVERYGRRERRIDLLQGRADFQVQGDPARPFVVHAQGGTVTALGTRFQVRVGEHDTAVTLLEGNVRIATRPEGGEERSAALHPGQALRFRTDGRIGAVEPGDVKAAQAWTEGKLHVDGWHLQDLVDEINRYSDTRLRIDDAALRELPISGTFYTRDRDGLARMLEAGWGIRTQRLGDREILLIRQ